MCPKWNNDIRVKIEFGTRYLMAYQLTGRFHPPYPTPHSPPPPHMLARKKGKDAIELQLKGCKRSVVGLGAWMFLAEM